MIVRDKKHIVQMLFIWKGSVLKKIAPTLLAIFLFSWLVYWSHYFFPDIIIPLNVGAFALVGISLAIFLGFCNSAAYDRYWEGRKQWGSLVIHSRSLAFQLLHYIEEDETCTKEEKQKAIRLIIAFCYALNKQLRNKTDLEIVRSYLTEETYQTMLTKRFKPAFLLSELTKWVNQQHRGGRMDSITQARIDQNLEQLSIVLGACERIVHTKIPFVYFVILHRTVYVYSFLLPFGLIDLIVWTMPFFVTFVAYTFIALDAVVAEIAEPFGEEENDLALDQMCSNIAYSLSEVSDLPLPALVLPNEDYIVK
ncbi:MULTISPECIES: bestrophin family protein [unclassified Myroides]|uniref:bestrophin family protein n=1 Tax=unclassified Myroides TaxID=2642485 RepID=UPI003D2F84AB